MRLALVLLVLLLAGCSTPSAPQPEAPLSLAGKDGLLLVDAARGVATVLSTTAGPAWISPTGAFVVWAETGYDVVQAADGARSVAPAVVYARVTDEGAGIELAPGEARTRDLRSGNVTSTAPLPPAPRAGAAWLGASANLSVVAGEYAGVVPPELCQNQVVLRMPERIDATGCHVKVADDGRVGWTQQGGLRIRHTNGTLEIVAGNASVAYENPVFTRDGFAFVRVVGGARGEIVVRDATDEVVATVDDPQRVALHGITGDGRYLLATTFRR